MPASAIEVSFKPTINECMTLVCNNIVRTNLDIVNNHCTWKKRQCPKVNFISLAVEGLVRQPRGNRQLVPGLFGDTTKNNLITTLSFHTVQTGTLHVRTPANTDKHMHIHTFTHHIQIYSSGSSSTLISEQ